MLNGCLEQDSSVEQSFGGEREIARVQDGSNPGIPGVSATSPLCEEASFAEDLEAYERVSSARAWNYTATRQCIADIPAFIAAGYGPFDTTCGRRVLDSSSNAGWPEVQALLNELLMSYAHDGELSSTRQAVGYCCDAEMLDDVQVELAEIEAELAQAKAALKACPKGIDATMDIGTDSHGNTVRRYRVIQECLELYVFLGGDATDWQSEGQYESSDAMHWRAQYETIGVLEFKLAEHQKMSLACCDPEALNKEQATQSAARKRQDDLRRMIDTCRDSAEVCEENVSVLGLDIQRDPEGGDFGDQTFISLVIRTLQAKITELDSDVQGAGVDTDHCG